MGALEVSSHGIALRRIQRMAFDVQCVSKPNARLYLDFYGGMEAYCQDKQLFIMGETNKMPLAAVINIGDPYGKRLTGELSSQIKKVTFGIG